MKKIVALFMVLLVSVSLYAKGDLHIFDVENSKGGITPSKIADVLSKNGFTIALSSEMTTPFKKQFQTSDFKVFTLLTVVDKKFSQELVSKYPNAGIFIPMGVGIYQGNNEKVLHVSVLTSDAQAKIIGIKNNKILKSIESDVLKALTAALPDAKQKLSEDSLKESRNLITLYELKLDGTDWESAKQELDMNLQSAFSPHGFVMPASMDFDADVFLDDKVQNPFDFYETYSICKLPVIHTVAGTRPEAAAFAPCSLMVYKKKGENKIVLGFPAVYNWLSSARVQDKEAHDVLMGNQTAT